MWYLIQQLPRLLSVAVIISVLLSPPSTALAQWTQWGGPSRNFSVSSEKLADRWPEDGPRKLWSRPLGEAYSTILVDGDVLYTMAHADGKEQVVALSAKDGTTIWVHSYESKPFDLWDPRFGPGARATPLVQGDYVYTVGVGAMLHCLDKKTGKPVWSQDLKNRYEASPLFWGYSSSPIAYKDTIIVPVGAKNGAVMAFDAMTGKLKWRSGDAVNGYSAPILIDVDGEQQLVAFMGKEVMGLNPDNGDVKWRHPHVTSYDVNASTPIWGPDNILFISSDYGTGARGLKLTRDGKQTTVKELWHQRKMGIHFGSAVLIGDYVYGSTGNSRAFLSAINVKTGEIAWREGAGLTKSSVIHADGKLIIVDEDGKLALATVSPEGIKVQSAFDLFNARSWSAPTLVGHTLFVRDLKQIVALDLS